jgi:hypothetical protein
MMLLLAVSLLQFADQVLTGMFCVVANVHQMVKSADSASQRASPKAKGVVECCLGGPIKTQTLDTAPFCSVCLLHSGQGSNTGLLQPAQASVVSHQPGCYFHVPVCADVALMLLTAAIGCVIALIYFDWAGKPLVDHISLRALSGDVQGCKDTLH